MAQNFWGEMLKELRKERNLSFRQVGVATKVNRITLRRLEDGEVSVDVMVLERLLDYYGYELDAIQKIPTSLLPMPDTKLR